MLLHIDKAAAVCPKEALPPTDELLGVRFPKSISDNPMNNLISFHMLNLDT